MDTSHLTSLVSIILALSISSERPVEIIKGFIPSLNKKDANPITEGRHRSWLQILAVISGIITAWLARDYFPTDKVKPTDGWSILGLGLLASGRSGLWSSVLTYVTQINYIKKMSWIN